MKDQVLKDVELMITTINKIFVDFSVDYFETEKLEKIDLSKTIAQVPYQHIAKFRLYLHESINDYLVKNKKGISLQLYYRIKTLESIDTKIKNALSDLNQHSVDHCLNDILGIRIILDTTQVEMLRKSFDRWKRLYGLIDWAHHNKDGYRGVHINFRNKLNYCFPSELQIWDEKDELTNIEYHEKNKRIYMI